MKESLPALDGLSGYACMLVVLSHLPWPDYVKNEFNGLLGAMGVGVFFVLSGFLMGYLYINKDFNASSVVSYSISSFCSIVPIYWFVMFVYLSLSFLLSETEYPFDMGGGGNAMSHMFLVGSSYMFWSMPLEIQYYIFFMLMWFLFSLKLSFYKSSIVVLCLGLLLFSFDMWPGLILFSKLPFFLAGTFFGMLPSFHVKTKFLLMLIQVVSVALLFAPFLYVNNNSDFYNSFEMSLYYGVCIYFISHSTAFVTFFMENKYMSQVGYASFSMYLIHLLLLYFLGALVGLDMKVYNVSWFFVLMVTILMSMFFYNLVEVSLHHSFKTLFDFLTKDKV